MNKKRRDKLREILSYLQRANEDLSDVCEDEAYSIENTPENLQASDRFQESEETLSALEEANDSLNDIIEQLQSIV